LTASGENSSGEGFEKQKNETAMGKIIILMPGRPVGEAPANAATRYESAKPVLQMVKLQLLSCWLLLSLFKPG